MVLTSFFWGDVSGCKGVYSGIVNDVSINNVSYDKKYHIILVFDNPDVSGSFTPNLSCIDGRINYYMVGGGGGGANDESQFPTGGGSGGNTSWGIIPLSSQIHINVGYGGETNGEQGVSSSIIYNSSSISVNGGGGGYDVLSSGHGYGGSNRVDASGGESYLFFTYPDSSGNGGGGLGYYPPGDPRDPSLNATINTSGVGGIGQSFYISIYPDMSMNGAGAGGSGWDGGSGSTGIGNYYNGFGNGGPGISQATPIINIPDPPPYDNDYENPEYTNVYNYKNGVNGTSGIVILYFNVVTGYKIANTFDLISFFQLKNPSITIRFTP
jgi:hypothetical protein